MAKAQKKTMKFRLLRGGHQHGKNEDGSPKRYKRGDIIETDIELDRKLGADKFQRLHEEDLQQLNAPIQDTFSSMSVNQLKDFAASEEIDLSGATTRADILKAVREATGD